MNPPGFLFFLPQFRWASSRAAVSRCRKLVALFVVAVCVGACTDRPVAEEEPALARNVIVFVGDGMGLSTVTAARILDGQLRGEAGEDNLLSFERFTHTAFSRTYTVDHQVGDSAGTMTAMMTGQKTRSGMVAVSADVERGQCDGADAAALPTLLQEAAARGFATGVVTNTRITHATPAATYAHTPERLWESDADMPAEAIAAGCRDIARQLVESGRLDVALGGGRTRFLPESAQDPDEPQVSGRRQDGRHLIDEWQVAHPDGSFLSRRRQLLAHDPASGSPVLGLFGPSHLHYEIDRAAAAADEPSLIEMTVFAVQQLQQQTGGAEQGFVLVVEGGLIDHAHHANNAHRALHETVTFAAAIEQALALVDRRDTLVIVTADHSHTLTLSGFPARGNPILDLVRDEAGNPVPDAAGRPFTTLNYGSGPGSVVGSADQPAGAKQFPHWPLQFEQSPAERPDLATHDVRGPDYLQESVVPLTSGTHGGEDVPVYADGPGAERVRGVLEQNEIHAIVRAALGW